MQIDLLQFIDLSNKILSQIDKSKVYRGIICPLNGGLYLSDFLSKHLNLPIYCIDIKSYNKNNEQEDIKIKNFMAVTVPGNYLICDDIYDTGTTVKSIIDFYSFQDKFNFDIAVLVTKQIKENLIYGVKVEDDKWIDFWWELI